MSTTMLRKEDVQRKWYVLDAAGKPLGKTAALAADLLRGKLKPEYTPHVDCGDFVIIINASKAILTGNKLNEKKLHKIAVPSPDRMTKTAEDLLSKEEIEAIWAEIEAIKKALPKSAKKEVTKDADAE